MAAAFGLGDDTLFCQRLYEVTSGVPFFVQQWLHLCQVENKQSPLEVLATIPDPVYQVIERRIQYLSDEERHLAQSAVVAGEHFSPALLCEVCGQALPGLMNFPLRRRDGIDPVFVPY